MKKVLFLLLVLLFSSQTFAREDFRTYYSDLTYPAVWVKPKNIKVYIYPSENKYKILKNAFETWDDALGSDLNFKYIDKPDLADITIQFVEKLSDKKAGETRTSHVKLQGRIYLGKADIYIAKKDYIGFICTDLELLKTSLHEIGHAIGILGHSENITDIMYYSTASHRQSTLSDKDIETVRKIYGF